MKEGKNKGIFFKEVSIYKIFIFKFYFGTAPFMLLGHLLLTDININGGTC